MTRSESLPPQGTTTTGPGPRLGLALVVIATAQLMVVLDSSIVNVALPQMQRALHFSGTGLEWVVNAYAITFGGLLLLGGRAGDRLGRRRVFIWGMVLFSAASLAGGFATTQWWLLTARALQGVGAAAIAPTSLSLVSTTFPEGKPRNQAMGVLGAMAGVGLTVGLIAGGLLTSYISWRWVLFVNVPIGVLTLLAVPSVLAESPRRHGRFDLPGAIVGTAGVTLLVYGLIHAATDASGVSHWGDTSVVASLAASVVLLVAFAVIELRSRAPLMPPRVLADRDRAGAYLIALCVGTAISGVFFFLTVFVQNVWGYSPLRTGLAYVPMSLAIIVGAGLSGALITKVGARSFLVVGALLTAAGMFWVSAKSVHSNYPAGMLGPTLISGLGLGLVFTPMTVVGMSRVREQETGAASSMVNAGRQVGGALGLAVLGTVAWTTVSNSVHAQVAKAIAAAAKAGHPLTAPRPGSPLLVSITGHALATGFARGFILGGAVILLAAAIAAVSIRVGGRDLEEAAVAVGAAQAPEAAAAAAVAAPPGAATTEAGS